MEQTKLLIDTDIGDDIDDLFALYFALRKNIEIVGVTTVFKDTIQRAKMVKKLFNEEKNPDTEVNIMYEVE